MNLDEYRSSPRERERVADLLRLLPGEAQSCLDIGARDGFISRLLAERFARVTALDLEMPQIDHPRITCAKGNAASLPYADASFDVVFCAEVLEHIPSPTLEQACREMARVARHQVLVGVPYKQDIRVGRTTCRHCGGFNPPWGHLNSFDTHKLDGLFAGLEVSAVSYVGEGGPPTNRVSSWLMDKAGNPYGTYDQEEPCIFCGSRLEPPPRRTALQRVLTRVATLLRREVNKTRGARANWVHVLYEKQARPDTTS